MDHTVEATACYMQASGAQQATQGFIAALGTVPPFTWLQQATLDKPLTTPAGASAVHRPHQQAEQATGAAHDFSQRYNSECVVVMLVLHQGSTH